MILKFIVENDKYINIKQIAKEYFEMSERLIAKLKNKQLILKNGIKAYINEQVSLNDLITFDLNYEEENDNILPNKMILDILYEDDAILVINKPPFVAIHPLIGHFSNSLANGVKYYFSQNNINKKIRPVNRLDKDTSGIVVFAKNEYIQECLIKQMQKNVFTKTYLGIIKGCFNSDSGTMNFPISRKENSIIEREVNSKGQSSITHFKILEKIKNTSISNDKQNNHTQSINEINYSLVEFKLETGRTHQIRVHCSHMGCPLLGDNLYGSSSDIINRQALHCFKLEFIHPISKEKLCFMSDLPSDMKQCLNFGK